MRRPLLAILILAALLRLWMLSAAWSDLRRASAPDTRDYLQLAMSLGDDGTFGRDGAPEIFRTPGYPMILLIGAPFGDSWWRAVILLQTGLDVLLVYLTFMLGSILCSRAAGVWAAAFQALSLAAATSAVRVLSDSTFALLATMAVVLLVHHWRSRRWWLLVAAGAMLAAACYVRPVGLLIAASAVIVMLIGRGTRLRALALAGIVAACLAPWVARNYTQAEFAGFSSVSQEQAFSFEAPAVIADARNVPLDSAREQMEVELKVRLASEFGQVSPDKVAQLKSQIAMDVMRRHPLTWARVHFVGSLATFLPAAADALEVFGVTAGQRGTLTVLREQGLFAATKHYFDGRMWALALCAPAVIILAIKYGLAILCAIRQVRPRMAPEYWFVLLLIVTMALAGGVSSTPRFRVPIEPLLNIAAGAGIAWLLERRWRRRAGDSFRAEG